GFLVIGAFVNDKLPSSARTIDEISKGRVSSVIKRGDLEEKPGASLLLHDLPGIEAERVLLVSLGKRESFGDKAFREALHGAAKSLAGGVAKDAALALVDLDVPGRSLAWKLQTASRLLADGAYRFDAPGANKEKRKQERGARRITLLTSEKINDRLEDAVDRGQAIAEGMALAKDLGNLPGNV